MSFFTSNQIRYKLLLFHKNTIAMAATILLGVGANAFGQISPKAKATIKKQAQKDYIKALKKGKLTEKQIKAK